MAKMALWAVARVGAAAQPRWHGPDGRPLQRPWRVVQPQVAQRVRWVRANRPQPWWPRALGLACLGIAAFAALLPVRPMPRHVAPSASASPVPRLQLFPVAAHGARGAALRFGWVALGVPAPYEVVVLGPGGEEVLRSGPLAAPGWTPTAAQSQRLALGEIYQWCVLGGGEGEACSTLQSFRMR